MHLQKFIEYLNLRFPTVKKDNFLKKFTRRVNHQPRSMEKKDSANNTESFKLIQSDLLELIKEILAKAEGFKVNKESKSHHQSEIDDELVPAEAKDSKSSLDEIRGALLSFIESIAPSDVFNKAHLEKNIKNLINDTTQLTFNPDELIKALSNQDIIDIYKNKIKEKQPLLHETYDGRRTILKEIQKEIIQDKKSELSIKDLLSEQEYKDNINKIDVKLKETPKNLASIPKLIEQYRRLKDAHKGIISNFKEVKLPEDKSTIRVLHRDARRQPTSLDIETWNDNYKKHEHWAIMGLHFINAAKQIFSDEIPSEKQQEFDLFLNSVIDAFCKEIQSSKNPKALFVKTMYEGVLLEKLKTYGINNAKKRLEKQKDYVNLEYDNFYHVTQVKVPHLNKPHYFNRIGIPKAGNLDYVIYKHYEMLVDAQEQEKDINQPMNIAWFDKLSNDEKRLVRKNAHKILNGAVISNQVLGIPGIKNGREEFLLDDKGDKIFSHTQTGTLANKSKAKDFSTEATWHAKQQLNNLSHQTSPSELKNTNSELKALREKICKLPPYVMSLINENYFATDAEDRFTKQIIKATDKNAIRLPTQSWRVFLIKPQTYSLGNLSGLLKIAQQLEALLRTTEGAANLAQADYIKEALEAITYWQGKSRFNQENANFQLAVAIQVLANVVGVTINGSCKSAKDRMGAVEEAAMHHAVLYKLTGQLYPRTRTWKQWLQGVEDPHKKYQEDLRNIRKSFISSSPVAIRAGGQGASMGADGILGKPQGGLPDSWDEDFDTLIEDSAPFNKGPKNEKKFYRDSIFLGFMFIAGSLLCLSGFGLFFGAPMLAGATAILASATGASISAAAFPQVTIPANAAKSDDKKPWYKRALAYLFELVKKPSFWIGLLIVAGGALLCATGFGAIGGIPAITTAVPWMLGVTAAGIGAKGIQKGVANYYSTPDPKRGSNSWSFSAWCKRNRKLILAVTLLVGVALIASGFGAPAGVAMLGATALTAASAAIVSSAAISTAVVGGVIGAATTSLFAYNLYEGYTNNKQVTNFKNTCEQQLKSFEEARDKSFQGHSKGGDNPDDLKESKSYLEGSTKMIRRLSKSDGDYLERTEITNVIISESKNTSQPSLYRSPSTDITQRIIPPESEGETQSVSSDSQNSNPPTNSNDRRNSIETSLDSSDRISQSQGF